MFFYEKALALGRFLLIFLIIKVSLQILLLSLYTSTGTGILFKRSFCLESPSILDTVLSRMRIADCHIALGDYHNSLKVILFANEFCVFFILTN
jgi:hypothetical protein